MKKLIALSVFAALAAPCLHAHKAVLTVKKDGSSIVVDQVGSETLHGVESKDGKTRLFIWELITVRYNHANLDDFNSLASKAVAGRGEQMISIAVDYIKKAEKELPKDKDDKDAAKGVCLPWGTTEEERNFVRLTSKYYLARGQLLANMFSEAQASFLDYMKDAEAFAAAIKAGGKGAPGFLLVRQPVAFDSPTGGKVVDAALLHRLYLDALEGLGDAYARGGDPAKANSDAYDKLVQLTSGLSKGSVGRLEFFDWAVRALRSAANLNEKNKNYQGAHDCYVKLREIAALKAGREKDTRELIEARLNIGFMLVKDKKYDTALASFRPTVNTWESARRSPNAPMHEWINPDKAFSVAGSYLGMGMVESARARDNANASSDDWGKALNYYSNAIALFSAGDGLRARCLLLAAEACSKMGEIALKKKDNGLARRHGETASGYLFELSENLKTTDAAQDADLGAIRTSVDKLNAAK